MNKRICFEKSKLKQLLVIHRVGTPCTKGEDKIGHPTLYPKLKLYQMASRKINLVLQPALKEVVIILVFGIQQVKFYHFLFCRIVSPKILNSKVVFFWIFL